jgi:hypothetical protein
MSKKKFQEIPEGQSSDDDDNKTNTSSKITLEFEKRDISVIINIITACSQKNIFTVDDYKAVGELYEKLKIYR